MVVRFSQVAIHVESVDVTSGTTATVTVGVDGGAHPKSSNVLLTNPDHGTTKTIGAFSVV